ncbi:hypothetical protein M472_05120 [Sphingobacterium paucimobilis HER1398]|uniref:Transporter n=1 Tax=Sphingobacterium paucimobilis HER1398 TaxID=1346330 RepID=U2H8U7_9SPHI|nr:hypothetical protein M472_05120 [Sphingobacterium paucimobilis HER1398]
MRVFYYIVLILIPCFVQGQSVSIEELWKQEEQAIAHLQHSLEIRLKKEQLRELKVNRIPVFYFDANLQRNLIVPTTPVPAIAFDPNATDGAIIPLKFATKWSSKAGVQVEWDVFDPRQSLEEERQSLNIRKAELEREQQQVDWRRGATLAYAAVVLATEQYALAQADSVTYWEILEVAKARYEEGRDNSFSYLIAQQEFERKRIKLHEAWAVLCDADLEMEKYMDLDSIKTLSSSVSDILSFIDPYQTDNLNLISLGLEMKNQELEKRMVKRSLYPSFKANAYLGEQYYSNQFRLDRGKEWYGSSYVSLSLRLPLSAFFTIEPTLKRVVAAYDISMLKLREETNNDRVRMQQRELKISTARSKLASLKVIVGLTEKAREQQHLIYKEGRLLLSDLNQSISQVNEAKRDEWQASYDLIRIILD